MASSIEVRELWTASRAGAGATVIATDAPFQQRAASQAVMTALASAQLVSSVFARLNFPLSVPDS